jgi:hypothetical protein
MFQSIATPKPLRFILAASFAALMATSCSKKDLQAPETPAEVSTATSAQQIEELRQFVISSTGENSVSYTATTKEFIIGGDGVMPLEDAKEQLKKFNTTELEGTAAGMQHRRSFYVVAPAKAVAVKIFADATVPAVWLTALDKAIANWNASGSKLVISRTTTPSLANTTVKGVNNGGNGVLATANYPDYNSNAGKFITINTFYNSLAASKQIFAITHELGHTYGFGHTNSTYGTLVPNSPNADPNSIMNAVCLNWSAFTAYDLQAIRTIYPK